MSNNTLRQANYSFIPDRWALYGSYYETSYRLYPGSAHRGSYQPVAFGDGSVRMMNYLQANLAFIADGNGSTAGMLIYNY